MHEHATTLEQRLDALGRGIAAEEQPRAEGITGMFVRQSRRRARRRAALRWSTFPAAVLGIVGVITLWQESRRTDHSPAIAPPAAMMVDVPAKEQSVASFRMLNRGVDAAGPIRLPVESAATAPSARSAEPDWLRPADAARLDRVERLLSEQR